MIRILLIILFSALLLPHTQAQFPVRVQVNVVQPVPPYLPQIKADIAGNRAGLLNQDISSHISIILSYTGRNQQHIKLAGSIQRVAPSPIGVSLRPDFQPAQPIIMGPQQAMISLTSSMLQSAFGNFQENSLIYTNTDLDQLRQNGIDYKLPEGMYRVCVTAYDYDKPGFSAPLSAPGTGCAYFTICYTASAPQLILPVSTMLQSNSGFQDFVPHSPQIQFVWTPPATTCGMPLGALTYDLEIRRVFNGQTVSDAVNNPYVFHQQNIPMTSFLLDTLKYAHVLVTGQQYTVRVKANFMATIGSPLEIANQGYSQIAAFTYQPPSIFPGGNGLAANNPAGRPDSTAPGLPIPPGSIKPGGYIVQSYSPTSSCPAATPITNTTPITGSITGQDLTIGAFRLHIDNATANKDGSYTGTGYIVWHPFASDVHLAVGFDTLKVNTDKVVYGGIAHTGMASGFQQASPFTAATGAATAAGASATSATTDAALTSLDGPTDQSIKDRISSSTNLLNQATGNAELSFPLGLNTTLGGAPFTLAIMGISFQPACTNMNVLLNLNLPDLGGWLSLAGTGLQIDPNKLLSTSSGNTGSGGNGGGVLYLPQEHDLHLGTMHFNLDGCPNAGGNAVDTSKGTYVQWDATNGLGKIVVNADIQFTDNNSIVAVDATDKRLSTAPSVHAKFSFTDWNDWVASATLNNDFELAGLPGFPIHSDGLFYDHSSHQNPGGIVFPPQYAGAQDVSFQGLYIPSLTMSLPGNFSTFSGSKPGSFGFTNFILDNNGVTTTIGAKNILDISTGSLGGWAFSIDQISIGIVQNTFQDGMQMSGQLMLPVSSTGLAYTCNLNSGDGKVNYQFVVHPAGQLDIPLWLAKISLDPNSSLVIANDANGMAVKSHLNGSISVDISVKDLPTITLPGLSFQDMAMANRHDTTANAAPGFYFDAGKWSFGSVPIPSGTAAAFGPSSPDVASGPSNENDDTPLPYDDDNSSQSSVSGFSISLSNFSPSFSPNSSTEFEAGVYFNLNVNIGFGDASVISGTTRLGILGKITVPGTSAPTVGFDKLALDSISLHGGLGPVIVDGNLWFVNNDATYGNGIQGNLSADFTFAKLEAAAQFGTTLGTGGFHYWAVGGSIFLEAGFPIGPGITCNGFGGGIYHNMTITTPPDTEIRNHSTTPGTIPMVPQINTTGIQAELIVAVIQPTVVNASLTLSVEIHNGSLGVLQLNGNGFAITDPPGNTDAVVTANMVMKYDFANQIFDTYIDGQFHFLFASVNAPIWMHGGPDGDYLYIGRPDQGDGEKVSLTLISIGNKGDDLYVFLGGTAFFDAGTELPNFPPLPPDIGLDKSGSDAAVTSMLQSHGKGNAGFMFGADIQGHIRLSLLFLYAEVDAEVGFDVAFEHIATPPPGCTQADGTFGLNNWYGTGQIYAYFNLDVGLHVDAWFYSGDVDLVQFTASAALQAGLPNPSWVDGEVHVRGSALGGLVSVDGDFPFSFGSQCKIKYNPLDNIQMITDIGPKDSADVFATPYDAFSVPMNAQDYPITVPPDDQHTTSYVRTFRFSQNQFNLYKEEPDGSDSLVTGIGTGGEMEMSPDGLGSALYHHTMLQPHTQYKIYIQCGVKELINDQYQDPAGGAVTQDTTFLFTTGAAPTTIVAENVAYTYPISGQRFLLQNEFGRRGQIRMAQWQYNLLPPPPTTVQVAGGYNYNVYFISAAGDTVKTTFTPNQAYNSLDFTLPVGLANNTIYDLQVWVTPRTTFAMQHVGPSIRQQAQTVTNQVSSGAPIAVSPGKGQPAPAPAILKSSVTINKNIVAAQPQSQALGSIPIYTLRFQTSQYNAFADKIATYGQWISSPEDAFRDISITSPAAGAEEFDEFDIKGYTNTCSLCDTSINPSHYPPLFTAVIPWDNNAQNDKFASDNLYANAFLLILNGMNVDLGAPETRNLMHPLYTLSTDGIPYQPKLPSLIAALSATSKTSVNSSLLANTGNKPTTQSGSGQSSGNGQLTAQLNTRLPGQSTGGGNTGASGNTMMRFVSGGSLVHLPASYTSSNNPAPSPELTATTLGSAMKNAVTAGPRLLWKHDNYIYADYQLMQQFANSFLANQQNTVWMLGSSIPLSLLQAMNYGNNVSLAVGEYGSISANPGNYAGKWNDPNLTNIARSLQGLPFQPFPATASKPLQFNYTYPFCLGCGIGSTIPEQFSYGHVINVLPATPLKVNIVNPNMQKLKKP